MNKEFYRKLDLNLYRSPIHHVSPTNSRSPLPDRIHALANRLRQKPLLSAYHLAEWAAWNWWRLRWEPRSTASEWSQSHRMASIGSGYIWPDVTIFSDGERTALVAKPTPERPQTPFRYISDFAAVICGQHHIFYRVADTAVVVLRSLHGSMDVHRHVGEAQDRAFEIAPPRSKSRGEEQ